MRRRTLLGWGLGLAAAFGAAGQPAVASGSAAGFSFAGIDGAEIALADFAGRPVLVVNTASRCGFVNQFGGLQAVYDRYRGRGLTVIGVPSNSSRQELATEAAVKDFCEVNFAIDFPIAQITDVTGAAAHHPFYAWARAQGAGPRWNFHKILLDGEGRIVGAYGAMTAPDAPKVIAAIEALLPAG
ncbi:MAG: glutathione peroxidase [Rhodobacteraceae bacterium]|nr:glutathione peroxidase [Paracoccaceae bacterium]